MKKPNFADTVREIIGEELGPINWNKVEKGLKKAGFVWMEDRSQVVDNVKREINDLTQHKDIYGTSFDFVNVDKRKVLKIVDKYRNQK